MSHLILPKNYDPLIDLMESQRAIKKIKDYFQQELAYGLNLRRVSAPLFVDPKTGLNDNLNGVERRVSFTLKDIDELEVEVVQSLAKWKRMALGKYKIQPGHGIYTDMNAIRRDEELDNLHSVYVDQWDWEKVITKEQRTEEYLKETVITIYNAVKNLGDYVNRLYRNIQTEIPNDIYFVTTQELEDMYPDKTPKEREDLIAQEKGAVFLMEIGDKLADDSRKMIERVKQAGGDVFAFTPDPAVIAEADSGILLPECDEICALFSASTAMQMFACALSTARGLNPDNPRGLSKVTITK